MTTCDSKHHLKPKKCAEAMSAFSHVPFWTPNRWSPPKVQAPFDQLLDAEKDRSQKTRSRLEIRDETGYIMTFLVVICCDDDMNNGVYSFIYTNDANGWVSIFLIIIILWWAINVCLIMTVLLIVLIHQLSIQTPPQHIPKQVTCLHRQELMGQGQSKQSNTVPCFVQWSAPACFCAYDPKCEKKGVCMPKRYKDHPKDKEKWHHLRHRKPSEFTDGVFRLETTVFSTLIRSTPLAAGAGAQFGRVWQGKRSKHVLLTRKQKLKHQIQMLFFFFMLFFPKYMVKKKWQHVNKNHLESKPNCFLLVVLGQFPLVVHQSRFLGSKIVSALSPLVFEALPDALLWSDLL